MITQEQIDRINVLARKSKTPEGLTDDEKLEQKSLREQYVKAFRESLVSNLENTYIVDENGHKHKVTNKHNKNKSHQ